VGVVIHWPYHASRTGHQHAAEILRSYEMDVDLIVEDAEAADAAVAAADYDYVAAVAETWPIHPVVVVDGKTVELQ